MARYKHLGYYNDAVDIKDLFKATKREILNYFKKDYGLFYVDDEELTYDFKDFRRETILGKNGNKYLVRLDLPKYKKDISEDNFIDLYIKVEKDEGESPVRDRYGRVIHNGDDVMWIDPETHKRSRYEVFDEPTEDMVRLWSEYGECEALPQECVVVKKLA